MLTKKIYIPDEDVEIFKKAEMLSDVNFSKLIRNLIKKYVEEEMDEDGFWKIKLSIGEENNAKPKSFLGKPISDDQYSQRYISGETGGFLWRVYQTKKGQFVVYQETKWRGKITKSVLEVLPDIKEIIEMSKPEYVFCAKEFISSIDPTEEEFLVINKIRIPKEILVNAYNFVEKTKKEVFDDGFEDI